MCIFKKLVKFISTCNLIFSLYFNDTWGQDFSIVAVGDANLEREKIMITPVLEGRQQNVHKNIKEVAKILAQDFTFYKKKYEVFSVDSMSANPSLSIYREQGISLLIMLKGNITSQGEVNLDFEVINVANNEKRFVIKETIDTKNLRDSTHRVSNNIYKKLNGVDSIFNSKIVFVSDRNGTKKKPIKELYIMDFDGHNKIQLTNHRGTVISPAISHDGKRVLYSLINEGRNRNINLYMMDIATKKSELISSKVGMNSGAVFMPDGESILLTLSHVGNAELFIMDLKTKSLRRLTQHSASDVDPSITHDGKMMSFLSDRSGRANIYTADPTGREKSVKRISYVGQFNATPRFSPDGREIIFSSWLDQRFDIFRISASGENLSRLTKDFGSNEDPTYSNDGQFIAFSSLRVISKREASQNIYIMDRDGEIIGPITQNFGACLSPRWSKY